MHLGLRDTLLAVATRDPDALALWADGEHLTYGHLFERAGRLAVVLAQRPEVFCLLYCRKSATRYVAMLASVLAGKTFVPLCPTSPLRFCEEVLRQVGQAVYIFDSGDAERERVLLGGAPAGALALTTWAAGRRPADLDLHDVLESPSRVSVDEFAEETGAYLMFTSGSTGVPKAVLVTRANLMSYLAGANELFAPTPADRFAQINSYTFDLSMHDVFLAWTTGGAVYALPETVPYKLPTLLREHQITFWLSVPTTGLTMANLGLLKPASMPALRCTLFCGEPLPQRLAEAWHQAAPNGRLFNIYGPTECTIAVTAFEWAPGVPYPNVVPIGEPYPEQEVCIVDEQLQVQPPGAVGELCIAGTQVVPGYYRNPQQTQQRFVTLGGQPGVWYRTGDQVQRHPEWGLLFKGRHDDQMQVRGYRVERLEVEALMRNALGTDALAVIGWPVVEGNLVQGLVVFVGDQRLETRDIRRRLRSELPEYMWPSQIYIQELPQTRSRKVDYTALRRQLAEAPAPTGALRDVA